MSASYPRAENGQESSALWLNGHTGVYLLRIILIDSEFDALTRFWDY